MPDKIAVIGAGITGLTAAYCLAKKGHDVSVFEAAEYSGGIAVSHIINGVGIEDIYHHIFTSDEYLLQLSEELGLINEIEWIEPSDGFYSDSVLYPFTSPMDLLKFKPLPFLSRVLMGLLVLRSRYVKNYNNLENMSAGEWISKMAGRKVYEKVWKPLLKAKFDTDADNVAAVWIWNKFKLRGSTRGKNISKELLGYMRGSFGVLTKKLGERLNDCGGKLLVNAAVSKIEKNSDVFKIFYKNESGEFDKVLFTAAPQLLLSVFDKFNGDYAKKLSSIKYKANICMLIQIKKPLSKYYWTTVASENIPFVAVIEHTNIQPKNLYGTCIVYLTRYIEAADALFSADDEDIKKSFFKGLAKIYPQFSVGDVTGVSILRSRFSQPVITKGYSKIIPEYITPVDGLFLACMAQIYPEDRGMNYAVREGKKIADIMSQ
ncbi:MAG: NAD(P)/FAD-dependent oxidoreductase [Defluviitaleaceae bacterium]|nr:NAD(P)/FAD-dependent oxidoreductase [Defluviitaleaceae bacterium]